MVFDSKIEMMLVPDLMPILTGDGLRLASEITPGTKIWSGTEWTELKSIVSDKASARFYDYDFGNATFRSSAAAKIWQPEGTKCPAQLYDLTVALGPSGKCSSDPIAEWDGFFWAGGEWIDSLNRPCLTEMDESRASLLHPGGQVVKIRDLHVHKDSRIPRKSFEKRAGIPYVYMNGKIPVLRSFLRGYVVAKVTVGGRIELSTERHACTVQLALNAVGIQAERQNQWLRFPNTVQVNKMLGTDCEEREEACNGKLRAVLAKGELKCFEWDVDSCWMSGIILQN